MFVVGIQLQKLHAHDCLIVQHDSNLLVVTLEDILHFAAFFILRVQVQPFQRLLLYDACSYTLDRGNLKRIIWHSKHHVATKGSSMFNAPLHYGNTRQVNDRIRPSVFVRCPFENLANSGPGTLY